MASDWITDFMRHTEGITSPPIFRLWSGISAVAGVLERKVWVVTARKALFPNLFVLLVATPGIGKSEAVSRVIDLWYEVKNLHVAPSNMTKASLIDAIEKSSRKIVLNGGADLMDFHSLAICSSEFGVLVPAHDLEFLSVLNDLFDNPRVYREDRRTNNRKVEIANPQINLLAATQPGFLATLLPEEAWAMGTTSRLIMIYAGVKPQVELFSARGEDKAGLKRLADGLESIMELVGEFQWTPEAKEEISRWHREGEPPVPEHSKLQHYIPRRIIHVLKLAMISAASRTRRLIIELEDVVRGRDWLLQAESMMPDIFRDMVQRSDSQVIQELHYFMWMLWTKKKEPIHESRIFHFLQTKIPTDKVEKVLEVALRSNIIIKEAGAPRYSPRPKHEWGVE